MNAAHYEQEAVDTGAQPNIVKDRLIGVIVCVPATWTDTDVIQFLELNARDASGFLGVKVTWRPRRDDERNGCDDKQTVACAANNGFVHRVFMRDEAVQIVQIVDEVTDLMSNGAKDPAAAAEEARNLIAKLDAMKAKSDATIN